MPSEIRIGTAGWSVPKQHAAAFPGIGTHIERYARQLHAVEINSSFYRPHKPGTYARWAASVPPGFRFVVKLPREITHERRLDNVTAPLERLLGEVEALGAKLGPLLVQLPPSLRYNETLVDAFLEALRARFDGDVVCEPRHATWFTDAVDTRLSGFCVARVAADPAVVPRAAEPGGWMGITYRRLHGSPKVYHSPYPSEVLDTTARQMRDAPPATRACWCILDNTALGAATRDALDLLQRL